MRAFLSVLVLCLFAVTGLGDSCIGVPSALGQGAVCGGPIACASGLYCDKTSTCSPRLGNGAACSFNSDCVVTASCKGPVGSTICVTNANPGQPCTTSSTNTIPLCGGDLFCNPVTNLCTSGLVGDSCSNSVDCATNLTCTNGACAPVAPGTFCTGDYQCGPGYACVKQVCTAQISAGGDCTLSSTLCPFPNYCVYNPIANTTTCIAPNSLDTAAYCGGNGLLCKTSDRCVAGLCAPNRLDTACTSGCSFDSSCTCGGLTLSDGFGSCQSNPCFNLYTPFLTCATTKCTNDFGSVSLGNLPTYLGSCLYNNCNSTMNPFITCNSANLLGWSFGLVASLAVLVMALI